MAKNTIRGITIEFGADTSKLSKGLRNVNSMVSKTQKELRDVNRLLKFNPGNTELLKQKQEALNRSVRETSAKLTQLRNIEKSMKAAGVKETSAQFKALQREIVETSSKLDYGKRKLKEFGSVGEQRVAAVGASFKSAGSKISRAGRAITTTVSAFGLGAIYAGKKAIDANQAQIDAENKLVEIYDKRMGATKKAADATMEYASALQEQGVIGDEVFLSGAQQLATFAQMPETVNALLPAMGNLLVQQKGLNATTDDATQIANLFGKAMNGQTGALSRVGISFSDAQAEILKTGTEEERAAVLAEVVTQNVGDMNAKFAETDAGKMQQALNTIGDIGEEIGAVLLPAVANLFQSFQQNILPTLQKFVTYLQNNPKIADLAVKLALVAVAAGPLITVLGGVVSLVGAIMSAAPMLGAAFTAATGPIGLMVAAVGLCIAAGVALYKNWDKVKATVTKALNKLKTNFNTIFGNIKSRVISNMNSIKNGIVNPMLKARDMVKGIISKIKSFFNFKVSTPHIPLPHFAVTPSGWKVSDLLKGKIPHLGVKWYRRAMQNGMILDGATLFGMQNGNLLGGGEAGKEAIIGTHSLSSMVQRSVINGMNIAAGSMARAVGQSVALAGANNATGGPQTIEVYLFKNGPQMGRYIVDSYDTWKKRL